MATLNSGKVIGADGQFISVEDAERYLGVPDENGKVLASNTDGARFWTVAAGAQGSSGPQGAQGVQGATGTGAQGDTGPQGVQGAQGVQGDSGSQGGVGAQGAQGVQGAASTVPGPQGAQGVQGGAGTSVTIVGSVDTVTSSPPHTTLTADDSVFPWFPDLGAGDGVIETSSGDLWVYDGSFWNNVGTIVGPQGPQGVQGAQGAASTVPGPQGAQGVQGGSGSQGGVGPQGEQGAQGHQGLQGVQGGSGSQGGVGPQGEQGAQGHQGLQGVQGSGGLTGGTGPSGAQGAQGHQGLQGNQGVQGATGTGAQGVQGAPGPSTQINASAVTSGVYYPVFVAGTNIQTPSIRTATTAFSFDASAGQLGVSRYLARQGGVSLGTANSAQLEISNAGNGACNISFHREGVYGAHFGLDTDNVFSTYGFTAGDAYTSMRVGNLYAYGQGFINSASPTLYLQDTDHNSASIHVNSNTFYILRGGVNTTAMTQVNGVWPLEINLTNNNAQFGATLTAVGDINSNSDIKLKTNIKTLTNSLEKVCSLRGVEFDRIDIEGKHQIGFIAQELEEIVPELVSESNDIKSVAYGNITALLVEALKELKERVEVLEQNSKY